MSELIFGAEHVTYLIITCALTVAAIILIKRYCKSEKSQKIAVKISGVILLIFALINRLTCYLWTDLYFMPATLCGNLTLVFSLFLIFASPNSRGFHFAVYPAIVYCACANVYPTYLSENPSFWFPPSIFGLIHHSIAIYAAILLIVLGWMRPSVKHMLDYPFGYSVFIAYGLFNITVLGREDSMNIINPIISFGSIDLTWYLAGIITTVCIWIITLVYDAAVKRRDCAVCSVYRACRDRVKTVTAKLGNKNAEK